MVVVVTLCCGSSIYSDICGSIYSDICGSCYSNFHGKNIILLWLLLNPLYREV